ncbi:hypothetical protein LPJ53_002246 [Coemansia erecta]|uniref:WH2 domain-containing protein n=1 Tax=Coemansia erecta TaxID=147472 RepID=A0A9W7XYK8_9FUNG|nr:hypothetical protein LPJ53_002246 [Coemansia erecta]
MASRGALLQQIQQGTRLKKAQTNDRSGAQVSGSGSKAGGGGGGGGPPMGGMALPRPPVPPSGGLSSANASSAPAEPRGPPAGIPGLGGLFSGGMPKLKHRSGGVSTGRSSEDGGSEPARGGAPSAAPPPPPQMQTQTEQKPSSGSRFGLPFRRSSHGRSSSQADSASIRTEPSGSTQAPTGAYGAARQPPPPPAFNGLPALPGRRLSDAASRAPPVPPNSAPPSRPASSVSAKKPPPPPPSSRKPQIRPKPPGLAASRLTPHSTSPSPAMSSTPDLRGTLRRAASPVNARSSTDNNDGSEAAGGIIEESQGSVSSLAGMFGQRVRGKTPGHARTLTGNTFSAPPAAPALTSPAIPAKAPPPPSAPSSTLPPPPPPVLPHRPSANGNGNGVSSDISSGVPVREGKWTFHALADLPPPPPANLTRRVYPSGRASGSSVALDF